MSAVAIAPPQAPVDEASLAQLGRHLRTWFRKNIPAVIVSAAVGMAVGFITNIWIGAVFYQGTNGATAAGHGFVTATLLSGIATTVVFGVYGYYRAVGPTKFAADIRSLPSALVSMGTREGIPGWVHLLWGAAATMVATAVISPGVGAILAIGLLASAPGYLGRVLSTLIMRIWSQLLQKIAPTRKARPAGVVSMSVGVIGGSLAMLAGYLIPAASVVALGPLAIPMRLVIAVLCGGMAFVISRGTPGADAALKLLVLVAGAVLLAEAMHPLVAWATDGGSAECGNVDWAKYLSQCQGSSGVVALATAGAVASGAAAPVGYGLGNAAGTGDGGVPGPNDRGDRGDGGTGVPGGGPMHPPPPPPHFPHTFVRGNQVIVECANGVILSATLNPDGSLGPWSATNLSTQSGGQVANRVSNDDGSSTTHYTDGSVVTTGGPGGGSQTWGTDGSYTNATPDGQVTTTHGDGSVDVRNPDGTVTTTLPNNGGQTIHSPDGTVIKTNPDGSTFTYGPDGSVDGTLANGTKVHQSTDGTTVATQSDGTQTVQNNDGTTTVTRPDGSTQTKWPDGSSEAVNADGGKTLIQPDGTTYIHSPDGTVQTQNPDGSGETKYTDGTVITTHPDGSDETRFPDGTVSQTNAHGVETVWNKDGSVDTNYPNGITVTHNPDGTMSATGPDGRDLGDPNTVLHNLDQQSGHMSNTHPDVFQAVQDLQRQVAANGGVWTPAELATLMGIQNAANQGADQRHAQIVADQEQATKDWHTWLQGKQDNADLQTNILAAINKDESYIMTHLNDLPFDQAQHIRDLLAQVDGGIAPNRDNLDRVRQIMQTTFQLNTTATTTDAAIAKIDAAQADANAAAAQKISTSMAILEGGLLLPFGVASGVAPSLGGFYLGRNFVQGAAVALADNGLNMKGLQAAATEGLKATLPINTAIATGRALVGQGSVADVGWSLVRDAGNMLALNAAGVHAVGGDAGVNFWGRSDGSGLFGSGLFGSKAPTPPDPLWRQEVQSVHDVRFDPAGAAPGRDALTGMRIGPSSMDVATGKATMSQVEGWNSPRPEPATGPAGSAASPAVPPVDQPIPQGEGGAPQAEPGAPTSVGAEPHGEPTGAAVPGEPVPPGDPHGRGATPADNADFHAGKKDAEQMVKDWEDLRNKAIDNPHDPEVQKALSDKTADINASTDAKTLMKNAHPDMQADFVDLTQGHISSATGDAVHDLNAQGFQRGGRPIDAEADFWQVRNATSGKTVGMDLDLATNQRAEVALQHQLDRAVPGSPEAQQLTKDLLTIKASNSYTRVDPLTGATVKVTNSEFRDAMQQAYNNAYGANTAGHSADKALHTVTDYTHPEAYRDHFVLANRPDVVPFSPLWADQTGSVTSQKMNDLFAKVAQGEMTYSDALVEAARGSAKDISTKLEPMLAAYNADPRAMAQANDMQQFLKDVGSGSIPPTDAQRMSQNLFGTDIQGLVHRVDAGIATTAKFGQSNTWVNQSIQGAAASGITVANQPWDDTHRARGL